MDPITRTIINAVKGATAAKETAPPMRSVFEASPAMFTRVLDDGNCVRRHSRYGATKAIMAMIRTSPEVTKASSKTTVSAIKEQLAIIDQAQKAIETLSQQKNGMDYFEHQKQLGRKVVAGDLQAEPTRTRTEHLRAIESRIQAAKISTAEPAAEIHRLLQPINEAALTAANRLFQEEVKTSQERAQKFGIPFEADEALLSLAEAGRQMQSRVNAPAPATGFGMALDLVQL